MARLTACALLSLLFVVDSAVIESDCTPNKEIAPTCRYKACNKWQVVVMFDIGNSDNEHFEHAKKFVYSLIEPCYAKGDCDVSMYVTWPYPRNVCSRTATFSSIFRLSAAMQRQYLSTESPPANDLVQQSFCVTQVHNITLQNLPWICNCSESCANLLKALNYDLVETPYPSAPSCSAFATSVISAAACAPFYYPEGYGIAIYYITDRYVDASIISAPLMKCVANKWHVELFYVFIHLQQKDFASGRLSPDYMNISETYDNTPNYLIVNSYEALSPDLARSISPCNNTLVSTTPTPPVTGSPNYCEYWPPKLSVPKNLPSDVEPLLDESITQSRMLTRHLRLSIVGALSNSTANESRNIFNELVKLIENGVQCNETYQIVELRLLLPGTTSDHLIVSPWFPTNTNNREFVNYLKHNITLSDTYVYPGDEEANIDADKSKILHLLDAAFKNDIADVDRSVAKTKVLVVQKLFEQVSQNADCITSIARAQNASFAIAVMSDNSNTKDFYGVLYERVFSPLDVPTKFYNTTTLVTNTKTLDCIVTKMFTSKKNSSTETTTSETLTTTTQPDEIMTQAMIEESSAPTALIVATVVISLAFLLVVASVVFMYFKHRNQWARKVSFYRGQTDRERLRRVSTHPATIMQRVDVWEINAERVNILYDRQLGSGAFGTVFQALLLEESDTVVPPSPVSKASVSTIIGQYCAVKMLPKHACVESKCDFLREISILKALQGDQPTQHVIKLYGCVTISEPLCLITEYCANGDLLDFLRRHEFSDSQPLLRLNDTNSNTLSARQLLSLAWQVTDGMHYIGSRGYVHRDLAARNVFVDDHFNAKVGDFGLCRQLNSDDESPLNSLKLAIKWMAIESLRNQEFTTMSDVWSFGVLMYEIFSMGRSAPYSNVHLNNILTYLDSDGRLERPIYATDDVYKLMLDCWQAKPTDRPSFVQLRSQLAHLLETATIDYGYLLASSTLDHVSSDGDSVRRLSVRSLLSNYN